MSSYGFDSLCLHAGQVPDPVTGARAVPLYMTTAYQFESADEAAALFNLESPGHIYARISNPTVAVLEERAAALEGGVAALATASGHAAMVLAITTLMGSGGHIVSSRALYGGSVNLLKNTLPRLGIEATLVDPRQPEAFRAAIRPETKLIHTEVLGNPGLEVADLEAISAIAHEAGIPLMVDATFSTPALLQPIQHGADIIMHSATKWLGGHGLALGGLLVDAGRFDWRAHADRFPSLAKPEPGYHGVVFADEFGPAAFATHARMVGLRDFGASMSPANAFLILQGIETLPLRMERHVQNAYAVAKFLADHPAVSYVSYPGLESHPDYALAQKYFPKGPGSMLAFGVRPPANGSSDKATTGHNSGREAAAKFIENLSLVSHLANVGDAKTLALHPASTTHRQLGDEQLEATGIGPEMVRMSVGLESEADLLADIGRALKQATK